MMSLVFGVTRRATICAVTRKPCDSSALKQHAVASSVAHHVFERNPVRNGQNDLVAVVDEHRNDVEERVLAADRGAGFLALVIGVEVDRMAMHDRVFQFSGAADRCVFRKIRLNRGDGGVLDVLRRRKVRLARVEIDDVNTLLAQFIRLGYGRHGR